MPDLRETTTRRDGASTKCLSSANSIYTQGLRMTQLSLTGSTMLVSSGSAGDILILRRFYDMANDSAFEHTMASDTN